MGNNGKVFVVDDLMFARVMEVLLNQDMIVYNDADKTRYGFAKSNKNISMAYAQAKRLFEEFEIK